MTLPKKEEQVEQKKNAVVLFADQRLSYKHTKTYYHTHTNWRLHLGDTKRKRNKNGGHYCSQIITTVWFLVDGSAAAAAAGNHQP